MRISDWSSDVCSSDLCIGQLGVVGSASGVQRMKAQAALESVPGFFIELRAQSWFDALLQQFKIAFLAHGGAAQSKNAAVLVQSARPVEIGRASCRERVCKYV